jgi:hypothetical protein
MACMVRPARHGRNSYQSAVIPGFDSSGLHPSLIRTANEVHAQGVSVLAAEMIHEARKTLAHGPGHSALPADIKPVFLANQREVLLITQ